MKKKYNLILVIVSLLFMECSVTKQYDSLDYLESAGNTVDGLKVGVWKYYESDWDSKNTVYLTKKGHYKRGKKDGIWKSYDQFAGSKKPISISTYKDDVLDGISKRYNSEGELSNITFYKDGRKDGLEVDIVLEYRLETIYKNNLKNGQYRKFDLRVSNINPVLTGHYENNLESGIWRTYNSESKLISESEWLVNINKVAPNYEYSKISIERPDIYDNGQIKTEYQQKWGWGSCCDLKDGFYNEYYKDGKLKKTGNYRDDKKIGEWFFYHNNGELLTKKLFDQKGTRGMTSHRDVLRDGLYPEYDKDGNLVIETIYRNEIKILEKQYSKFETMSLFSFSEDGIKILEECCKVETDWIDSENKNTICSYGDFYSKYPNSGLSILAEENALAFIEDDWKILKIFFNPIFPEDLLENKYTIQNKYAIRMDSIKKKIELKIDKLLKNKILQNVKINETTKEIYSLKKTIQEIAEVKDSLLSPLQIELDDYINKAKSKLDKYNIFIKCFPNGNYVNDVYLSQIELESDLRKAEGNPYSLLPKLDDQIFDSVINYKNHKFTIINATSMLGNKRPNILAVSYKGIKDSSGYLEGNFDVQIDTCEEIYVPAGRYTITVSAKDQDNVKEYRSEGNELRGGFKSFPLDLAIYPDLKDKKKNASSEEKDFLLLKFNDCYKGFETFILNQSILID